MGLPKTNPRSDELLGELPGSSTYSHSWLCFVTMQRSIRERQRCMEPEVPESFPSEATQDILDFIHK